MTREFPLKEIAHQAGLSLATVDRVIHARANVPLRTARRVAEAITELQRQSAQTPVSGQRFTVDLVMEAPRRFSALAQAALEAELPFLKPAIFRCRCHFAEEFAKDKIVALLGQIAKRGSSGVILKAADVPEIAAAIDALVAKGIPVVTLVTDVPHSRRLAYVGIDNRAAGKTAAYLMAAWLKDRPARILVSLSSNRFRGEEEREIGFRQVLRENHPTLDIVELTEGLGRHQATRTKVHDALLADPAIAAVYSIGGGNLAIMAAFAELKRPCVAFIAHDLDEDNQALLASGAVSAVLHHDLQRDMLLCCQLIMAARGGKSLAMHLPLSPIQVITPFNLPLMNLMHGSGP